MRRIRYSAVGLISDCHTLNAFLSPVMCSVKVLLLDCLRLIARQSRQSPLPLSLFMLGIRTKYEDPTFASGSFALTTYLFN